MNTTDLQQQLPNKERSINDLVRFIKTRNDHNPNYSIFLGSGCSVSSGIPSGKGMVKEWRREIYEKILGDKKPINYKEDEAIEYLSNHEAYWYNKNSEYSSLFEKKYDLPRQRRIFVESEVKEKYPSLGYAYLIQLIQKTYFNTIFTTNFDDLANEAFYQFSIERPIVCAHDSSIDSITVTSKRPKIIKLHGDYLFDDIKSTLRETESLEVNMKKKLLEFSKEYGLIVIGYSGTDRSVMDIFNYLLKHDDYFKNGIYWCIRKNSEIDDELQKLLWKEKIYYVLVDGFDEFFAEIHLAILGNTLPIDTNFISLKSQDTIKSFITNSYLNNSKSPAIINALKQLKSQDEKEKIFDFIKEINDKSLDNQNLSIQNIGTLLRIDSLMKNDKNDEALEVINQAIKNTHEKEFIIVLKEKAVSLLKREQKLEEAAKKCDELIVLDPYNSSHYLQKALLLISYKKKIEELDKALEVDKYNYQILNEKAENLISNFINIFQEKDKEKDKIIRILDESLQYYPLYKNLAYKMKLKFIKANQDIFSDKGSEEINKLVDDVKIQNPTSTQYYELKFLSLKKEADKKALITDIQNTINKKPPQRHFYYNMLVWDILEDLNDKQSLHELIEFLDKEKSNLENSEYLFNKAITTLQKFADLEEAIKLLKKSISIKSKSKYIMLLFDYYLFANRFKDAEHLANEHKKFLTKVQNLIMQQDINEYKGKYKEAINILEERSKETNMKSNIVVTKSFLLLKDQQYKAAEKICQSFLEEQNFSKDFSAAIINYEIAKKKSNNSISNTSKKRLAEIIKSSKEEETIAAAHALMGDKQAALSYLKKAFEKDYSQKYVVSKWVVFEDIKEDINKL